MVAWIRVLPTPFNPASLSPFFCRLSAAACAPLPSVRSLLNPATPAMTFIWSLLAVCPALAKLLMPWA